MKRKFVIQEKIKGSNPGKAHIGIIHLSPKNIPEGYAQESLRLSYSDTTALILAAACAAEISMAYAEKSVVISTKNPWAFAYLIGEKPCPCHLGQYYLDKIHTYEKRIFYVLEDSHVHRAAYALAHGDSQHCYDIMSRIYPDVDCHGISVGFMFTPAQKFERGTWKI